MPLTARLLIFIHSLPNFSHSDDRYSTLATASRYDFQAGELWLILKNINIEKE